MSRVARDTRRVIAVAMTACGIAACGTGAAPSLTPAAPTHGAGCVTKAEATRIWTTIDAKLNAIEADARHGGVSTIATGSFLDQVELYLAQQLEANNFTEDEVDKLDSITVVAPGCGNGTLQLRVTLTLVKDNYVKATGQVDHADPSVGKTLHFLESFIRSGGAWKESDLQNLDNPGPSQTPQVV